MRSLRAYLAAAATAASAAAYQSIEGTSALIAWQGRTFLNLEGGAPDGTVAFDWPGVRFAFTVTGATWITMSLPSNNTLTRLRVTIDGFDAGAFFVSDSQVGPDYLLAGGLDAGSAHTVSVYNLVEPAFSGSKNFFMKKSLATLTTDGSFGPPPPPLTRSLEFIGDSLTAAFGSNGIKPCTGDALTEDNSVSWANLLCATFRANFSIIAWSGIGVYANSPNVQPPGTPTMPVLYTRSLGATGDAPSAWDFSRYTPDAVVINLGTNDFGHNQDNGTAWEAGFVDTYTAFVANITGEYYKRPSLPVFLAIGPGRRSSTPRYQPLVEQVIANVNAAGGSATFLDLQSVNAAGGCDNHPSAAEEPAIAAAAQPQLAKVMGW